MLNFRVLAATQRRIPVTSRQNSDVGGLQRRDARGEQVGNCVRLIVSRPRARSNRSATTLRTPRNKAAKDSETVVPAVERRRGSKRGPRARGRRCRRSARRADCRPGYRNGPSMPSSASRASHCARSRDAEAARIVARDIQRGLADVGADAGGVAAARRAASAAGSRSRCRRRGCAAARRASPPRATISSAASISVSLSGRGSSVAGEIAKLRP